MKKSVMLLLLLLPLLAASGYFYFGAKKRKTAVAAAKRDHDSVLVKLTDDDFGCRIEKWTAGQFSRCFGEFYEDKRGEFFVKSFALMKGAHDSLREVDVFVRIPKLDSGTFRSDGMYIMDNTKVICVFGTSDGGQYVVVKHADPKTFKAFRNVFGGKDSEHVFYEYEIIPGIRPNKVKVLSATDNCANCDGYFRDGDLTYHNADKLEARFRIPQEYKYTE